MVASVEVISFFNVALNGVVISPLTREANTG